jgi:hypothetical protein
MWRPESSSYKSNVEPFVGRSSRYVAVNTEAGSGLALEAAEKVAKEGRRE